MNTAIADVVVPEARARAWALVYWAVNVGLAFGLALAGLFADRALPDLFFADALTTLVFAGIVARRVPETKPPGIASPSRLLEGMGAALRDRVFATFLLLHLASLVLFTQWVLGLPLEMAAHGYGPSALSAVMAGNCAGVVVLQPLLAPRLRRFDSAHLLAASALLFGLGFGVNALGARTSLYVLGTALWTVGEVVGFPVASALVADLAPARLRGAYQGSFSMTWGLAFAISPFVSAEVFARAGSRALWLGCLVGGAAVALLHLALADRRRSRLGALRAEGISR